MSNQLTTTPTPPTPAEILRAVQQEEEKNG